MRPSVAKRFARAAQTYVQHAALQDRIAARVAELLGDGPAGPGLEIGAGKGALTVRLAGRFSPLIALDLTPEMLPDPGAGALRLVGDGEAPPIKPGSLAGLVSASAMHWFADPIRSLHRCLDLLAPGGVFSFAVFTRGSLAEIDLVGRETGFGSIAPLPPAERWEEALGARTDLECSTHRAFHRLDFPDPPSLLRSLRALGVGGGHTRRVGGRAAFTRFLDRYAARFSTPDGGVYASFSVLHAWGRRG